MSSGTPITTSFRPSPSGRLYAFVPAGLTLLAFVWLVTCGTWRLLAPEDFGQFFDVQAGSLLRGHWDVPREGIGFEAFVRDGKYYGYFGFAPAVVRVVLDGLFPTMWGRWSRISLTLGCAASLFYAHRLLLESRRLFGLGPRLGTGTQWVYGTYLLAVGLGSSLVFLASRAYVYHEAIVWGAALALGCYYHVLRYLSRPTAGHLAAACALCFASFFCRVSVGGGTVVALLLLSLNLAASRMGGRGGLRCLSAAFQRLRRWPEVPPWGHAAAAAGTMLAVVVTYVAVNEAKFGTALDGMPFRYYNQVRRESRRMARTRGKAVSWANVRTDAYAYFSPLSVRLLPHFPWVFCAADATFFSESRFDIVEPYSSLTASSPALLLLCVLGLRWTFGTRRFATESSTTGVADAADPRRPAADDAAPRPAIPVLGALAGGSTVLLSAGISQRYLHDFFPLLVLAGALGLHVVLALRCSRLRRSLWVAGVALVAVSIYANCAFALVYQRVIVWNLSDPRQEGARKEFARWQGNVDRLLGVPPAPLPVVAAPSGPGEVEN